MHSTRRTGSRRAVLAGLFLALGLVSASPVAAYPTTPEGEPLYLEQSVPGAATPVGGAVPSTAGSKLQAPPPEPVFATNGTDWAAVALAAGIAVATGLAALALIAVGSLLTSRRRSARAH